MLEEPKASNQPEAYLKEPEKTIGLNITYSFARPLWNIIVQKIKILLSGKKAYFIKKLTVLEFKIFYRIFELGLKKFGDIPEYVTCYIDYLSHLNEDNNTRVLFERVLSSGSLENEKSV